jgi:hypothetical protein
MKKSIAFAVSVALIGSIVISAASQAAQVLTPKKNGTGADISTAGTPGGVALPAGTVLPIDVLYSVDGSQTKDEAGLGLKVQYDGSKFDPVVVYDVNGVQTSTSISNLLTKCMIASPSDQLISGNNREVVFGWIDTSIRTTPAAGAVGWPGTDDPAAPGATNGCLNPGSIVTTSAATANPATTPVTLFRMGLRSKSTFSSGSTNVVLTTAGNFSYANTGNVDTNKTILVNAAAAPLCNLDVDGSGSVTPFRDGILIVRHMLGLSGASLISGLSPAPDAQTVTNNVTAIMSLLDINGSLPSAATTPFVDGILLVRMMLNLNGPALTSGVLVSGAPLSATNSTRFASSDLINYVNQTCSTSFAPGP